MLICFHAAVAAIYNSAQISPFTLTRSSSYKRGGGSAAYNFKFRARRGAAMTLIWGLEAELGDAEQTPLRDVFVETFRSTTALFGHIETQVALYFSDGPVEILAWKVRNLFARVEAMGIIKTANNRVLLLNCRAPAERGRRPIVASCLRAIGLADGYGFRYISRS